MHAIQGIISARKQKVQFPVSFIFNRLQRLKMAEYPCAVKPLN